MTAHIPPIAEASEIDRLVAVDECRELMFEYGRRMDHGPATSTAELFTADGEWLSAAIHCRGQQELRDFFLRREQLGQRITRHVVVNISIQLESTDHATGKSIAVEYRSERGRDGLGELTAPALVGNYEDIFHRVDGVWRFRRRNVVLDFKRPGEVFMVPDAL